MIERVIRASVENRVLVLFGALLLAIAGIVAVLKTPVDALPDLSDVQVIIKTDYSGQAPPVWAGSISTLWWTNPERTIWKACGRSRTGFSSMN